MMETPKFQKTREFMFVTTVRDVSGSPRYHIHESYEMLYLISGKLNFFIEDRVYAVSPGNMILIPKGAIHKSYNSAAKYRRVVWNFTDTVIDKTMQPMLAELFAHQVYAPTDTLFMQNMLKFFMLESQRSRGGDLLADTASKHYLNILLLHLIRNRETYRVTDTNITNPTIERLIREVNRQYHLPITLKDVAHRLQLTPNYLSKLFHENTGMRFKEYLTDVRMKHARSLLEYTEKSISEIADACGFNDSNYFSTAFKSAAGVSPKQYRKNLFAKIEKR